MCSKILIVDEKGLQWIESKVAEGSLRNAQDNIGDFVKYNEDRSSIDEKTPHIYDSYLELLDQIDLKLIKMDVEAGDNPQKTWHAWINHIWTLKPDEQRILLKKLGIRIK